MKPSESKRIFVDSHQHFWDPKALALPALPPEAAVLDRAYLPADLEPEIRRVGVDYTVLVVGYPQELATNRWLFSQANATSYVAGVVGWVNLMEPDTVSLPIEELKKEPKFVGIRHIVEKEPDADWIVRDRVLESLWELARLDVAYDMLVKPPHLKNVLKVLEPFLTCEWSLTISPNPTSPQAAPPAGRNRWRPLPSILGFTSSSRE